MKPDTTSLRTTSNAVLFAENASQIDLVGKPRPSPATRTELKAEPKTKETLLQAPAGFWVEPLPH